MRARVLIAGALVAAASCYGQQLFATQDFFRPDAFGGVVASDRTSGAALQRSIFLTAARDSYASFHLAATDVHGPYAVTLDLPLTTDLYREWFHLNVPDGKYYPDALIPVRSPYRSQIPEPDNRVPSQTAQAFWVDVWIPADAKPGVYRGRAELESGGRRSTVPISLTVVAARVPAEDAVTLDNNSYGTSWMQDQYPKMLASLDDSASGPGEDALLRLIHDYHRIFYEHRGVFHQLGYGHAGKVGPEFAPVLSGTGRTRHVADWTLFDRHYGPLLDGSAFANTRRGARPIAYMYLPINPEWPASFLWWREPGYKAEFVNVVSEMERHFREKHWTATHLEVFFNHKKRYMGFPWDGDEIRFDRDNEYLKTYHDLLKAALPADTPVKFVMRADVSWDMERQFRELNGVVKFWVAGQGELSWFPGMVQQLKARGDIVWTYGGTPVVAQPAVRITVDPLRSWISGVQGFVRWLTVSPGPDPWFHFGGGAETLVYPGERFGVNGPLASVRLKLQRNCLQDLALLEAAARRPGRAAVASGVVERFNHTKLTAWQNTRPPLADKPVIDWNNADIGDAVREFEARFKKVDSDAWVRVHDYALEQAQ